MWRVLSTARVGRVAGRNATVVPIAILSTLCSRCLTFVEGDGLAEGRGVGLHAVGADAGPG